MAPNRQTPSPPLRGGPPPEGGGSTARATTPWTTEWGSRPKSTISTRTARSLRRRMTPHEVKLWNWLRERIAPSGFHFRRQVPISRYVVDFACLRYKVIVEIDGAQHGMAGAARD